MTLLCKSLEVNKLEGCMKQNFHYQIQLLSQFRGDEAVIACVNELHKELYQ